VICFQLIPLKIKNKTNNESDKRIIEDIVDEEYAYRIHGTKTEPDFLNF
jgi:disulfide oxidoreductase YuzD